MACVVQTAAFEVANFFASDLGAISPATQVQDEEFKHHCCFT